MKKVNELASEKLIKEYSGRIIKHPSVIQYHTVPTTSKLTDTIPKFVSIDIETNYLTGEMRLLGVYDGEKYWYYEDNFLSALTQLIKYYEYDNRSIVIWSRFDPTQLFRLMIEDLPKEQQNFAIKTYGKISGDWNKKEKLWNKPPVVEREINGKMIGISTVIRNNLQFTIRGLEDEGIGSIWTYNIAPFFAETLEPTAKRYFDWYSKIDTEAHLLDEEDWKRFKTDIEFRTKVLLSNELDAKACYYLAIQVMEEFASVFYGKYPKSLISSGSLTRGAIASFVEHKYKGVAKKLFRPKVNEELQSIGIKYHEEAWRKQLGEEVFKDFYSLAHEIYKGAIIECYEYGYIEKAYTADKASAYPSTEIKLPDLRDSIIDYGIGIPPIQQENEYIMIRGTIDIPDNVDYHTFIIRNPIHNSGNICPVGNDIETSYWYEERKLGKSLGIQFKNEKWYRIKTSGKLSILAEATHSFLDLRQVLKDNKDPNEIRPKESANGVYGVSYESTPIYEIIDGELVFNGLRGGEDFNPIYASYTTMQTRIDIVKACTCVQNNGGTPLFSMTDSVTWSGKETDLNEGLWKYPKSVGYFEKPEEIRDLVSLGAGRYQYAKKNKENGLFENFVSKTRGIYLDEVIAPDGVILDNIGWREALNHIVYDEKTKDNPEGTNRFVIKVKVKVLVTAGMILANHNYTIKDMGKIVEVIKKIDPISGRNKRNIEQIEDYKTLAYKHYSSKPIPVSGGMILGQDTINDTLPEMREELMKQNYDTKKNVKTRYKKDNANKEYRDKYFLARKYGKSVEEAKKIATKSWSDVMKLVYN